MRRQFRFPPGALHAVLIVLLLVAQHAALGHALLHAGRHAHAGLAQTHVLVQQPARGDSEAGDIPDGQPTDSCAFDLVYSQVLGGVHGGHAAIPGPVCPVPAIVTTAAVHDAAAAVPYDSRAPPALS